MKNPKEIAIALATFQKNYNVNPLIDATKGTSITCPYCGTKECTPLPKNMPKNEKKKYLLEMMWCIKTYKIDNYSLCTVCDQWF